MKRRILIKKLEAAGWYLLRNGSNHDVYTDGVNKEEIPRHREVNEYLARSIIKKWNL